MVSADANPTSVVRMASSTNPLTRLRTLKVKLNVLNMDRVDLAGVSTLMGRCDDQPVDVRSVILT